MIRDLLASVYLPRQTLARAQACFLSLAKAEAASHGVAVESVVFHEVGADDALFDIVGCCALVEALGVERIWVSPVPLGRGLTVGAHGPIPLPAPATLHQLMGVPTVETGLLGETVTPTGAALLKCLADGFGPIPSMTLKAVGVGAGHKRWPDRPNVLRALLGESSAITTDEATSGAATSDDRALLMETNLDDMSPEQVPGLLARLLEAGAADAWTSPIGMKKGRAGLKLSLLCSPNLKAVLEAEILTHSTSLGLRWHAVHRARAPRALFRVDTPYGSIAVKQSERPDGSLLLKPEHDEVAALARKAQVSERRVFEAAIQAARLKISET